MRYDWHENVSQSKKLTEKQQQQQQQQQQQKLLCIQWNVPKDIPLGTGKIIKNAHWAMIKVQCSKK